MGQPSCATQTRPCPLLMPMWGAWVSKDGNRFTRIAPTGSWTSPDDRQQAPRSWFAKPRPTLKAPTGRINITWEPSVESVKRMCFRATDRPPRGFLIKPLWGRCIQHTNTQQEKYIGRIYRRGNDRSLQRSTRAWCLRDNPLLRSNWLATNTRTAQECGL